MGFRKGIKILHTRLTKNKNKKILILKPYIVLQRLINKTSHSHLEKNKNGKT